MNQVYSKFLCAACIYFAAKVSPVYSQQQSENPGMRCPEAPRCECPPEKPCPEPPTCQNLYDKLKECAPSCTPKLCDGSNGPLAYDVTADCRVTLADAREVEEYLNSGKSRQVDSSNRWFDTNGDGNISPLDVLVVMDLINSLCQPTPTHTPTPISTPPPTSTPTPTPTPTPTATPPCSVLKVNLNMLGYENDGVVENPITGVPSDSVCANQVATAIQNCVGRKRGGYRDDWYALCFADLYLNGTNSSVGQLPNGGRCNRVTRIPTDPDWIDPVTRRDSYWHHISGNVRARYCLDGHLFIRKQPDANGNCIAAAPTSQAQLCGGFDVSYIKSSPISLMWEPGATVDAAVSVVRFPLNPSAPQQWVAWKASEKTPLLVYDPKHTGVITSARQLFGNWTFGGKQHAALNTGVMRDTGESLNSQWEHGFEALATLDADGNGKVDKAELAPLALWFDRDQDGVSDEGEVVDLRSLGVTALYYNATVPTVGRDVHLKHGFDRLVDGKLVSGEAVDWYGAQSQSKLELLGNKILSGNFASHAASLPQERPVQEIPAGNEAAATFENPFAGLWEWRLDDAALSKGEPPGLLILGGGAGVLQGYSVMTLPFTKAPSEELGAASLFYFVKGFRTSDAGARSGTLTSDFGKAATASSLELSEDGLTIKGKTQAVYEEEGQKKQISYEWSAKKISK
jgi:hypothetical protein